MKPLIFLLAALFVASFVHAQRIPLINSGEVLTRATELQDSQKYELAIKQLLTIPKRDTNYMEMQQRLADLYVLNKEYDKGEAVASEILKRPSEYRGAMIAVRTRAYEKRKDYAKALQIVQAGLKEYPFHIDLLYQIATIYHNSHDYKNAIKAYYNVIALYPYSKDAHLNLGNIAVLMGEKTHAMMSYGMYLTLANTENAKLVTLENVASNQLDGEGSHASERAVGNAYERLDQIIISKIAMDKKFQSAVPIDAATVKQFEMIFQQLNTASATTDDPWMTFYAPIYSAIRDQKMIEPFIYHILASTPIEAVKKWNSKNGKKLDAYFAAVNKILTEGRSTIAVPAAFGYGPTAHAVYADNYLQGIGAITNGLEEGKWIYLYQNGERSAEGTYKGGKKIGVWTYYSNKGSKTSDENEDNGEITTWEDGRKTAHYFLKDAKIDGAIEFYNDCGAISETQTRKLGVRAGKSKIFYDNGMVKSEFEYADNKLTNTWTDYDVLGHVTGKYSYKDDKGDGPTEVYWPNGKLKERDTFVAGKQNGPTEAYYENGQLQYKGQYLNNAATGEWLYYRRSGKLHERRFYKDDALDKEHIFYIDEKPWVKYTYDKGKLVQVVFVDREGKETSKFGSRDGNFNLKTFYPTGRLQSEGGYKNGKRDGKWKLYHADGTLDAEYIYVDGDFHGEQIDYYRNGKKKFVSEYKNGVLDGYRQEFYVSGQLSREGWYVNGQRQQQSLSYYVDGTKQDDTYFLNDKETDSSYTYSVEGRLTAKMFSVNGVRQFETVFNPLLPDYTINSSMQGDKTIKYPNGSPFLKYSALCGQVTSLERFYPDGKTFNKAKYTGDKMQGMFEQFDEFGKLAKKGNSVLGDAHGEWTFYNELGKPDQVVRYVYGKIDSIVTAYYEFGGIYYTVEYDDNSRNGITRILAPDGTPIVEKRYLEDELLEVRMTGKNGQFEAWQPFLPNMSVIAYYPNGKKSFEEQYTGGTFSNTRRIYFPDGKLCTEYRFVDGEHDGPFVVNYPNGKVCLKGQYRLGEMDGVLEVFQDNGMKLKTITYKMGTKKGTTTVFKNGVKSREILYFGYPIK